MLHDQGQSCNVEIMTELLRPEADIIMCDHLHERYICDYSHLKKRSNCEEGDMVKQGSDRFREKIHRVRSAFLSIVPVRRSI